MKHFLSILLCVITLTMLKATDYAVALIPDSLKKNAAAVVRPVQKIRIAPKERVFVAKPMIDLAGILPHAPNFTGHVPKVIRVRKGVGRRPVRRRIEVVDLQRNRVHPAHWNAVAGERRARQTACRRRIVNRNQLAGDSE